MNKVIFLLDMDAFFASCHMVNDPSLKNKNVVVASTNRRAIITTASYNARKFGISAGTPVFKAKELCPDLYIAESDFNLYIQYSHRVFDIIYEHFTKNFEVASIDECYIDVTNIWKKHGTVKRTAQAILNKIFEETGLTCSIGISTNKFLAKTAVDFNKPFGISFLLEKDIPEKLWPLPIKEMHMVGEATEKIMKSLDINTIGDLAKADVNAVISSIGKRGYVLWNWANGIGNDSVTRESSELKSIGNEMTLHFTTTNKDEIEEIIYELSLKVSERAKKRYLVGKTIAIVVKFLSDSHGEYNKKERKKHLIRQETITDPTNDVEVIYSVAKECLYDIWEGDPLLLLGVRLTKLSNKIEEKKQITFDEIDLNDTANLNFIERIIYDLNIKFGKEFIFTGNKLLMYNEKNRSQSKYLKNDDVHLSNKQIMDKWKGE